MAVSKKSVARREGVTLHSGGKAWKLTPVKASTKSAFEEWLQARDRRRLSSFSTLLPLDAFLKRADRLAARAEAGDYAFDGELCQAALATPDGVTEILRLCLLPNHPHATTDDAYDLLLSSAGELKKILRRSIGKPAKTVNA